MTDAPVSHASTWALAFLRGLVERGIRDLVLSPGSRSQALALAAAAFDDAGLIALHVVIDERVAAFRALGIAVESGRPVAVIVTSGTALANLHPGLLEAHHQGVPIIAITADRPESLRLAGVNQTTVQPHLFGFASRAEFDIPAPGADAAHDGARWAETVATAAVTLSGPIHLNVQFVEPLSSPMSTEDVVAGVVAGELPTVDRAIDTVEIAARPGVVVVAGHGAGARAEEWARELGAPLIAEIASGAHFGPHLVTDYRRILQLSEFRDAIDTVLVVGRPTLARAIDALCAQSEVDVVVVRGAEAIPYRPSDSARVVDTVTVAGDGASIAMEWGIPWSRRSRMAIDLEAQEPATDIAGSLSDNHAERADFARHEMQIQREPVTPEMLVRAVWDATWPHDRLVFGASRLIRVADSILPGKPLVVHSNRGLSGIDGTISTAAGIAAARRTTGNGQVGVTRVLLGDLSAQHDVGAVATVSGPVQIIVGNDGGGRIFDDLAVAHTANPEHFERVMRTPQRINFEGVAQTFGIGFHRVTNRGELATALSDLSGPVLIEVVLPRD